MFRNKFIKIIMSAVISVSMIAGVNAFYSSAQGEDTSSGYSYSEEDEFNEIASGILNCAMSVTLKDRASGVTASFADASKLPDSLSVSSYSIVSGSVYEKIKAKYSSFDQFEVFAVELSDAGTNYPFDGTAVFSIPIPDGFTNSECVVYSVSQTTGASFKCLSKQSNTEVSFIAYSAGIYYIYNDNGVHLGDVDLNGEITAGDARLILRYCARLENLTETQILSSDINADGKVNTADSRLLLRYVIGLEILKYLGG